MSYDPTQPNSASNPFYYSLGNGSGNYDPTQPNSATNPMYVSGAGGGGGGSIYSVFGRTGVVVAQTGDYSIGQISGVGPLATETAVTLTSQVTGTLPIANGGTGQTTATTALTALLPSQTGASGQFLSSNGTVASWATVASGGGAVASVFGRSGAVTAQTGDYSFSQISGTLGIAAGGTGQTTASTALTALLPSQSGTTNGQVLQSNGTVASWATTSGSLPTQTGNNTKVLTTNGTTTSWAAPIDSVYDVRQYGALLNDKLITDATVTSGSAALISPSQAAFTAGDVGKNINVNFALQCLAPTITSITQSGVTGASTYYYVLTTLGTNGGESIAGPEVSTSTGNATLGSSNYNIITWPGVVGGRFYKVYRGTVSSGENLLCGYVAAGGTAGSTLTFNDKYVSPSAGSPPGTNGAAYQLATTIASFTSATQVSLGVTPTFSMTGATVGYGSDDTAAIQAAVNAAHAAGGGTVLIPASGSIANGTGAARVSSQIAWLSQVNCIGWGMGTSILRAYGANFSTFLWVGNVNNNLTDCSFANFQMDGSMMSDYFPFVSSKGFNLPYALRCRGNNLYVHHYPATGIAFDFSQQNVLDGCIANNNGRLGQYNQVFGTLVTGFTFAGSSGFGIGTGAYPVEDLIITNCTANYNGHNGIFWEFQNALTYKSTGMKAVNCTCQFNYDGGIVDSGVSGMYVSGCYVAGNLVSTCNGQIASYPGASPSGGDAGFFCNNTVIGTGGTSANTNYAGSTNDGIAIWNVDTATLTNYTVCDNKVSNNPRHGISLNAGNLTFVGGRVTGNKCWGNGSTGICVRNNMSYATIEGNECFNNGQNSAAYGGAGSGILLTSTLNQCSTRYNTCYDTQTVKTQPYGIVATSTFTNSVIQGNNLLGNLTGGLSYTGSGGTTTSIRENVGYNPVNTASVVSVGASPWTYQAGNSPESVYLYNGTGMFAAINGTTIAPSAASVTGNLTLNLGPNQILSLGYSSTAPTMVKNVN